VKLLFKVVICVIDNMTVSTATTSNVAHRKLTKWPIPYLITRPNGI